MEQFADLRYPARGLDTSRSVAGQAPGTTPKAVNVRLVEPKTLRARGGSRPGLTRYAGRLPTNGTVQDLNTVVYTDVMALGSSFPPPDLDPVTGLPPVIDPSTPGDPASWGMGQPIDGTTGLPAVDPDLGTPLPPFSTRNPQGSTPGGGSVAPRKKRDGGDGYQPNPNVLMYRPESAGPHRLFTGSVQILIHKGAPDPFGWNGQQPAFGITGCMPYNPPLIPAPVTAFAITPSAAFPPNMTITQQITKFLTDNSVLPCTYDVVSDTVNPPGAVC